MPTWYAVEGILIFRKHDAAFGLEPRGGALFELVHLADRYARHLEAIEARREVQRARRAELKSRPQQFGPPSVAECIRLAVNRLKRRERQARAAGHDSAADACRAEAFAFLSRWYDEPARDHAGVIRLLSEACRLLRAADRVDPLCEPLQDVARDLRFYGYDPLFRTLVDGCAAALLARASPDAAVQRILATVSKSFAASGPLLWDAIRLRDREHRKQWQARLPADYAALRASSERIARFRARSIREPRP